MCLSIRSTPSRDSAAVRESAGATGSTRDSWIGAPGPVSDMFCALRSHGRPLPAHDDASRGPRRKVPPDDVLQQTDKCCPTAAEPRVWPCFITPWRW